MDYEVKLEIFEGPLDLLLHLINKNEVDIFDIPIATITDQYLGYLELMKTLNINVAGDFLVMASTLIHIKSKMLLPDSHEEDDEDDPRTEIMQPLLEYIQFKEIAEAFSEREILDRDVFARTVAPYLQDGITNAEPELDVSLFQLIDAFKRIVDQRLPGAKLTVQPQQWSIKDKTELIIARLKERGAMFFREIFSEDRTVSEFVVTFLALLELVHRGFVRVFQPTSEGDIRLIPSFDEEGENGNGLQSHE
jgi:segregation and condensation protein A